MKTTKAVYILLTVFAFSKVYAQNPPIYDLIYQEYEDSVDVFNSALYNGEVHQSKFNVINEYHPYFLQNSFKKIDLNYKGNVYLNIPVKYDVFLDRLLIKHSESNGSPIMVLYPDYIPRFSINNHDFEYIDNGLIASGYYEEICNNDVFKVIKKFIKKKYERTDSAVIYHEFKNKSEYFIQIKGSKFIKLKSEKTLINEFKNFKSSLVSLKEELKNLKKEKPDQYIEKLVKQLEDWTPNKRELK